MAEPRPHAAVFPSANRVLVLFWLAFWLSVMTLLIGRVWDSNWHATHTFDGFFSPPHLFIYAMSIANFGLFEVMLFNGGIRRGFGPGLRTRLFPFEVPGGLAIMSCGYALLAVAGLVLDNLWHTAFGLDETIWSFPHAMLVWSWLLVLLGFLASFLSLYRQQLVSEYTLLLMGFFVLGLSVGPVLGPFYQNTTPEIVRAVGLIPVIQAQPDALHVNHIYLHWNLTRANPLLVPLGAFWAGAALSFLRRLDSRARIWLAAAFFWTLITILGDYGAAQRLDAFYPVQHLVASWLPLPLFPTAVLLVILSAFHVPERRAWVMGGLCFGLLVAVFWGMQLAAVLLVPLAALTTLLGVAVGTKVYAILAAPSHSGITLLVLGSLGAPFIVGCIDLYLRSAFIQ